MSRLAFLAVVSFLFSANTVKGQLAATQSSAILNHFADVKKSLSIQFGNPDFRHASFSSVQSNVMSQPGQPAWTGSTSNQSFSNGKFGRFYCWDAQGNLRSSYLFLDISGKKKRGLKLALTKHRLLFQERNRVAF